MHRADKHLVDTEYMGKVAGIITKECDEFDEMYLKILREIGKIK